MKFLFEAEDDNEYIKGFTRYESSIVISSNYNLYVMDDKSLRIYTKFSLADPSNHLNMFGYVNFSNTIIFPLCLEKIEL